jgi:hypothetical protein
MLAKTIPLIGLNDFADETEEFTDEISGKAGPCRSVSTGTGIKKPPSDEGGFFTVKQEA